MNRESTIERIRQILESSTDSEMPAASEAEAVFNQMPITLSEIGCACSFADLVVFAGHDVFRAIAGIDVA